MPPALRLRPDPLRRLAAQVGIHSGPLIGGVAGISRRFYRLFGDTMNTAARMCHHAPLHRIQVWRACKRLASLRERVAANQRRLRTSRCSRQQRGTRFGDRRTLSLGAVPKLCLPLHVIARCSALNPVFR